MNCELNCETNDIITKVSEVLNIHEERLIIKNRISEENDILQEELPPGHYIFDYNKNTGIISNVSSFAYDDISKIINDSNNEIIIVRDIIHSNIEQQKKETPHFLDKETNHIEIINDKYIVNDIFSNDVINFLEETIKKKTEDTEIEKWENGKNVNAKYVTSEYVRNNNVKLFEKINKSYIKILNELHCINYSETLRPSYDNTFTIRKIYGPTRKHTDGIFNNSEKKDYVRHSSCIISLNDNYIGGEFIFKDQKLKYKMNKNDIIVFPPYHTHPHLTLPLEDRTYRYTINTWFLVK